MAAPALLGIGLLCFSFSREIWLSLPLMSLGGFAVMVHLGASNIVVQTIVDEDKRGRVMSLYVMAFMGMSPLGSLLAGALASEFGPPFALRLAAGACVLGSIAFALQFQRLRALVRPIYVAKGILPELPTEVYPPVMPAPSTEPVSTEVKSPE